MITNAIILSVAYFVSAGSTLAWVFYTRQPRVPRNPRTAKLVAVRFAIVFVAIFTGCAIANLAAWIPLLVAAVLWLLILSGNILGAAGIPLFYVVQQYVLGFPDRDEWFLAPTAPSTDASDPFLVYIGKRGSTASPLKPSGEVNIAGEKFPAASESGDYINADTDVVVRAVRMVYCWFARLPIESLFGKSATQVMPIRTDKVSGTITCVFGIVMIGFASFGLMLVAIQRMLISAMRPMPQNPNDRSLIDAMHAIHGVWFIYLPIMIVGGIIYGVPGFHLRRRSVAARRVAQANAICGYICNARSALAEFGRTGESPLLKWQTHHLEIADT